MSVLFADVRIEATHFMSAHWAAHTHELQPQHFECIGLLSYRWFACARLACPSCRSCTAECFGFGSVKWVLSRLLQCYEACGAFHKPVGGRWIRSPSRRHLSSGTCSTADARVRAGRDPIVEWSHHFNRWVHLLDCPRQLPRIWGRSPSPRGTAPLWFCGCGAPRAW